MVYIDIALFTVHRTNMFSIEEFITSNTILAITTLVTKWNLNGIITIRACVVIESIGTTCGASSIERKCLSVRCVDKSVGLILFRETLGGEAKHGSTYRHLSRGIPESKGLGCTSVAIITAGVYNDWSLRHLLLLRLLLMNIGRLYMCAIHVDKCAETTD